MNSTQAPSNLHVWNLTANHTKEGLTSPIPWKKNSMLLSYTLTNAILSLTSVAPWASPAKTSKDGPLKASSGSEEEAENGLTPA